jgi:hypothetical protein
MNSFDFEVVCAGLLEWYGSECCTRHDPLSAWNSCMYSCSCMQLPAGLCAMNSGLARRWRYISSLKNRRRIVISPVSTLSSGILWSKFESLRLEFRVERCLHNFAIVALVIFSWPSQCIAMLCSKIQVSRGIVSKRLHATLSSDCCMYGCKPRMLASRLVAQLSISMHL